MERRESSHRFEAIGVKKGFMRLVGSCPLKEVLHEDWYKLMKDWPWISVQRTCWRLSQCVSLVAAADATHVCGSDSERVRGLHYNDRSQECDWSSLGRFIT